MATMMQIGRGTYRVERRHLDDPLKPYLAPIRVDLPSFHIAIEYSAEQLPILPPVIVYYPNGTGAFKRYRGEGIRPAIHELGLEGPTEASLGGPASDDGKTVKKRKRMKTEKKPIVRDPRRPRPSSISTKRVKSCTNDCSPMPSPTPELPTQGQQEPTIKTEPVEHEHHFIPAPIRIYQHTTVIKKEP